MTDESKMAIHHCPVCHKKLVYTAYKLCGYAHSELENDKETHYLEICVFWFATDCTMIRLIRMSKLERIRHESTK